MRLELPMLPPTANLRLVPLLINGQARLVKSSADRKFMAAARSVFVLQNGRTNPYLGPVRLELALWLRVVTADISNRVKAVEDALTGLAYIDDCQVCELVVTKHVGEERLVASVLELDLASVHPELQRRLAGSKRIREARQLLEGKR